MSKFNKLPVLSKFHLDAVPFEDFVTEDESSNENLAKALALQNHTSWFMPQLLSVFGAYKAIRNDTGKYSPRLTMRENIGSDLRKQGMYYVACRLPRSALLKGQVSSVNSPYSSLVPLILAGFKKYQNIQYSEWDSTELKYIVDKNLLKAMHFYNEENPMPKFTAERLLELRDFGLTFKTGPKAGEVKPVLSSWTLTGMQGTEFNDYPSLLMTMLTQIWVAHPSVRNQYMVLDPINWDNIPDPLISTDLGISGKTTIIKSNAGILSWD